MKKYLFNLLFVALVVVLVRMAFAGDDQVSLMSCLSVVIIVAMMKVR